MVTFSLMLAHVHQLSLKDYGDVIPWLLKYKNR
jgi:hypothetical protein